MKMAVRNSHATGIARRRADGGAVKSVSRFVLAAICALGAGSAAADKLAGYPTSLRVEFVLECMQDREGSRYELMHKCSCVLDRLAARQKVDDFVADWTASKAISIAGERGAALRDNAGVKAEAQTFIDAVSAAENACFLRAR